MNIKKVLRESLENYGDCTVFSDKTRTDVYGVGFSMDSMEGNKSFVATEDNKFVIFDLETGEEHDMTDLIETLCDIIEEEIDTRLE